MNDMFVNEFNIQTSDQDGNDSAILKMKYYNPPDLVFQHLPVKEIFEKIEVNRMRNGYIIDTLTSVEIFEKVIMGGKVFRIYEGVIFEKTLK